MRAQVTAPDEAHPPGYRWVRRVLVREPRSLLALLLGFKARVSEAWVDPGQFRALIAEKRLIRTLSGWERVTTREAS